jgi:hypothetical protein
MGTQRDKRPTDAEYESDLADHGPISVSGITRRGFLGTVGGTAAMSGMAWAGGFQPCKGEAHAKHMTGLPVGTPLRVKPTLVHRLCERREKTSWRHYGELHTQQDVNDEIQRIEGELKKLKAGAEFPIETLPVTLTSCEADVATVTQADCDVILIYAAGGEQKWLEAMTASGKPSIMFLRHQSGPFYFWYETVHWWFLRKRGDTISEPHLTVDDIVVDDYDKMLWRLRALYGLKNARGTKVLAVGGLQSYSALGTEHGPDHARKVWGFDIKTVNDSEVKQRIEQARADTAIVKEAQRQADELIGQDNVTLDTERRFVVNSFLALRVFKDLMKKTGATNVGVARCMGSLISTLDTPPCLVLSLLNDDGFTAFCHVDFTHTPAGVLMRWISGKPSFVCNSHFPHDGMITLAHCAAPRRMNGRDYEPTKIMTHFESDYGAATRVEYTKGQVITTIIPNLSCTQWFGFRGKIVDVPSFDACRSQMEVEIDGDWRRLQRDMQGFHTITCYGDYLPEVGYVLKKLGIAWQNISETG